MMIFKVICSLIALGLFFVAYKQHKKTGIVFNNRYIFGSEKERAEKDWTDYYNQSRNVAIMLGVYTLLFLFDTYDIYEKVIFKVQWVLLILLVIYAIVSGWKIVKKHGL